MGGSGPGGRPAGCWVHSPRLVVGLARRQGSVATGSAFSCLGPQSCLEFSLRIQEFIELIRQNKRLDAVRYAARWAPGVRTGSHAREG